MQFQSDQILCVSLPFPRRLTASALITPSEMFQTSQLINSEVGVKCIEHIESEVIEFPF